jgi:hypothetical protein
MVGWAKQGLEQNLENAALYELVNLPKPATVGGGYIMVRHGPPGVENLPPIWPQIRADRPVQTEPPKRHYHGNPKLAPAADVLQPWRVFKPERMAEHIKRHEDHNGSNSDEVHAHDNRAKYTFPPTPKVDLQWPHTHTFKGYSDAERLSRHLQQYHRGELAPALDVQHEHVRRVKDWDRNVARRIDVHPLAVPLLIRERRVFFVLEGVVKADAVLTAGAAVFSVPSVTLWCCPELPAFADRYLRDKEVIVVCDSDWSDESKPEVMTQARLCQTTLYRLGVNSVVAAPPQVGSKKVGVDDFLHDGNRLSELEVLDRTAPKSLEGNQRFRTGRIDTTRRNRDMVRGLAMHAGAGGNFKAGVRSLARVMDTDIRTVALALQDLEDRTLISIEGDPATARRWFKNQRGDWRMSGLTWADLTPSISLSPEFRATDHPTRPLGETTD